MKQKYQIILERKKLKSSDTKSNKVMLTLFEVFEFIW